MRLLVQPLHVAGPVGPVRVPQTTYSQSPSDFRLPASGRRTLPLLLARATPTHALLVVVTREGRGSRKEAGKRRLSVVRGSTSDGRREGTGFGESLSSALNQALSRAVAEY